MRASERENGREKERARESGEEKERKTEVDQKKKKRKTGEGEQVSKVSGMK